VTVVVGEDGVAAMVDSGVPPRGADVASAVRAAARGNVPRTLVNTHWHFDHAGGNAAMVGAGVGVVVAHENTLARMSSTQHNAFFGIDFPAAPEEGRPTVTFPDRAAVRVKGRTLRLVHVPPAHTDGDVAVHVEEADVLVTGDLFSNGFFPFIDYSSGGSIEGMIAASEKLLAMAGEKTRVVPGHGAVGSRGDVQAARDMLADVRGRLAELAAKGMTLDEAVTARPLADFDATWGKPFFHSSHFVRLVYPAMIAKKS
jgi:glyoxylase-like metal-dependent hydrolase (beta-lactamase superfamily II)